MPHAQLRFTRVDAGEGKDSLGNDIVLGQNDSVIGRVAVTYEFGPVATPVSSGGDEGGRRQHPFHLMAGISHDLSDVDRVEVAGSALTATGPRTWGGELGLGGRWAFARGQEVYAEGSYRRPLGGGSAGGDRGLAMSLGVRLAW